MIEIARAFVTVELIGMCLCIGAWMLYGVVEGVARSVGSHA